MKKSFLVPVIFILNFCVFLFGGALFIAISRYLNMANPSGTFFSATFMHALYFFSPIACVIAIFAVFAFLMRKYDRYEPKIFLSIFFLLIMFGLVYALFTPFLYSKAEEIDMNIQSQNIQSTDDSELIKFIEPPLFLSEGNTVLEPILNHFYSSYKRAYTEYLILAATFFLMVFSFWICTICTNWRIINFLFLPLFFILSLYGYNYVMTQEFIESIKSYVPFELNFYYMAILYFSVIAILFFLYGGIVLIVRHAKNAKKRPKVPKQARRPRKARRVKEPKAPKERRSRREKKAKAPKVKKTREEKKREKELKKEEKKRARQEKREKAKRSSRKSRRKEKEDELNQPIATAQDIEIDNVYDIEAPDPDSFVMDSIDIPSIDDLDMEDYRNE